MPFEPFSLGKAIQAGQQIKMNRMKIQAFERQEARTDRIRSLAQMSTRPTYGPTEGPPEITGARPQIQTGTQYDPKANVQALESEGFTDEAVAMQAQIDKMSKSQREEATYKSEQIGRLAIYGDTPEKWAEAIAEARNDGLITEGQPDPTFDQREMIIAQSQKTGDMLKGDQPTSMRGVSTTIQEMNYLDSIKDPKERAEREALMMELKGRNKIKKMGGNTYLVGQDGSLYKIGSAKAELEFKEAEEVAKETGQVKGKSKATAQIDLPGIRGEAENLKRIVRSAIAHPGFSSVVGMPSLGKATRYVGGTDEAGFDSIHKQIIGKAFLQVYKDLKGGGQITEIEGEKATAALQRLSTKLSEEEYIVAVEEFIYEIDRLTELAEKKAGESKPIKSEDADIKAYMEMYPGRSREEIIKAMGKI